MSLQVHVIRLSLKGRHPFSEAIRKYGISEMAFRSGIIKTALVKFLNGDDPESGKMTASLRLEQLQEIGKRLGYQIDVRIKVKKLPPSAFRKK